MRKPMVSRTFQTQVCKATVLNVKTQTVSQKELELSRVYDEKKVLAKLQEAYDTEDEKVVHVTEISTKETLYGMEETEFLKFAKKLDKETRKEITEAPAQAE